MRILHCAAGATWHPTVLPYEIIVWGIIGRFKLRAYECEEFDEQQKLINFSDALPKGLKLKA